MFKKIISIAMALAIVIGGAVNASALCVSEDGRPGIVGMEYLDKIIEIDEAIDNGEIELEYQITMGYFDGYWVAYLEGIAVDGYIAFGMYDHAPTEEDFKILWANRMTEDEFDIMCEELEMN